MTRKLWAIAGVLLIAALLVGCPSTGAGGSDDGDDDGSEQADGDGSGGSEEAASTGDGAEDAGGDDSEDGPTGGEPVLAVTDVLALFVQGEALTEPQFPFGSVDPGGEPKTETITVENTGSQSYSLASVSSSNSVFPLSTPELPLSIAPGESAELSLSFDPTESGEESSAISFTVDGVDGTLSFTATGEGNYPPAARGMVVVSGAGTSGANGNYYRAGTQGTYPDGEDEYAIPYYEHADGGYYIWGQYGESFTWYIDDDLQYESNAGNTALYSFLGGDTFIPPSTMTNGESDWDVAEEGSGPAPTVLGELGPNVAGAALDIGTELEANYVYSDAEGDTEGETIFEWYRAGAIADPEGDYELIQSGTDSTYAITTEDQASYITVVVRPVASSGVSDGEGIRLGPSPFVSIDFTIDPGPIGSIDPVL